MTTPTHKELMPAMEPELLHALELLERQVGRGSKPVAAALIEAWEFGVLCGRTAEARDRYDSLNRKEPSRDDPPPD